MAQPVVRLSRRQIVIPSSAGLGAQMLSPDRARRAVATALRLTATVEDGINQWEHPDNASATAQRIISKKLRCRQICLTEYRFLLVKQAAYFCFALPHVYFPMDAYSYIANADAVAIETLYQSYQRNPDSVDFGWRKFFEGFDFSQQFPELSAGGERAAGAISFRRRPWRGSRLGGGP